MTESHRDHDHVPVEEAALARLADGSLPEDERAALRSRIAGSPELRARLSEQERALGLVRATGEIAAPAALRASVAELGGSRHRSRDAGDRRAAAIWRPRASVALVALAAALIAVVSFTLHGRTTPTVSRTARFALAAATEPAPPVDPAHRELLDLRPAGAREIPFPSYLRTSGWHASGARRDTLDGRHVTTVFYSVGGSRVGYSIVSGAALPVPGGPSVRAANGPRYVFAATAGAQLVTWRRDGHTCVIAGRHVTRRTLLALAAADAQI